MEENFKRDVIQEVRSSNGRILLHDEVEERPNVYSIVPLWENVSEEDIMTPGDVFKLMEKEGYKVSVFASVIRGRILSTFRRLITVVLPLCVGIVVFVTHESNSSQTDEQAPLPGALFQLLERVTSTYDSTGDFIFNCQMGRGRTTTGMITACLIASSMNLERDECVTDAGPEGIVEAYDTIDGPSEEEAYLQGTLLPTERCVTMLTDFSGEYKTILQLVGVLSHGKTAKQMADGSIDLMQDVQNLRKAVYECAIHFIPVPCIQVLTLVLPERSNKLKLGACEKGSTKYNKLFNLAANYLFVSIRLVIRPHIDIDTNVDIDTASSLCSRITSSNVGLAKRVRIRSLNGSRSIARLRSCWVVGHWTDLKKVIVTGVDTIETDVRPCVASQSCKVERISKQRDDLKS